MARMISLTKMKTRENALGDWKYFYIVKGPKTRFLKDGYRWDSLGSRPEIAAARFGIPISNTIWWTSSGIGPNADGFEIVKLKACEVDSD